MPTAPARAAAYYCEVTYTNVNQWNTGFQADVKITNTNTTKRRFHHLRISYCGSIKDVTIPPRVAIETESPLALRSV